MKVLKKIFLILFLMISTSCFGGDISEDKDVNYHDISESVINYDINYDDSFIEILQPINSYEIILLHDNTDFYLEIGKQFVIGVKVIDYATDTFAINYELNYAITNITNLQGDNAQGDAQLGSAVVFTNDIGIAHNTFSAGLTENRIYYITIYGQDAEPKTIRFFVTNVLCGCLNISLSYNGVLPLDSLKNIKTHVFSTTYMCDKLFPEKPIPPGSLCDRTATDLYNTFQCECLPVGNYYSIFVTANGPYNTCVIASGCNNGVFVQPDKCYDANVELYPVVLRPTGKYDCTSYFDFTNLVKQCAGSDTTILKCATGTGDITKNVCCALAELIKFFNTPGYTIIESITDIAKQWLGSIIVDSFVGLFKDAAAKIITDWLLNNSPQWTKDFFKIGQDMLSIITNLELQSDLLIGKLNNDFTVQGTQYWKGLTIYWKFGCNPQDPNYNECGKIFLSTDQLKNTEFPIDLVEGNFVASIVNFNKIIIDQHKIKLNYGKLVLFVLNEIIIAKITNNKAHSLKDAAHLWIDCKKISNGILGEIISWFVGTKQDVENVCNGTIDFLFGFVNIFVDALTLDSQLSLQGVGTLVDNDCNLYVENITNGIYSGFIEGESQQAAFTGTFSATKK